MIWLILSQARYTWGMGWGNSINAVNETAKKVLKYGGDLPIPSIPPATADGLKQGMKFFRYKQEL